MKLNKTIWICFCLPVLPNCSSCQNFQTLALKLALKLPHQMLRIKDKQALLVCNMKLDLWSTLVSLTRKASIMMQPLRGVLTFVFRTVGAVICVYLCIDSFLPLPLFPDILKAEVFNKCQSKLYLIVNYYICLCFSYECQT